MKTIYDIVIIGGGPAGLTAGIYAGRARMKALLLERTACGGQILVADTIENFPGFPEGVKGADLGNWMQRQAEHFGLEIKSAEAKGIVLKKDEKGPFSVILDSGETIEALSLIFSTGARWNTLNIPGEEELTGRGVSYCATCDGPLFKGKDVVVVGGGDTALEDALFLVRFANKVTIVHRRDKLRATKILQERAFANKRIGFSYNSIAVEVLGKGRVEAVRIKDVNNGSEKTLRCDGVFIFVGITPNTEIVKGILNLDGNNYIIADGEMKTSVDGIFACGDVRKKNLRQVVTAAGEGATAAFSARAYVEHVKGIEYK